MKNLEKIEKVKELFNEGVIKFCVLIIFTHII